jgi:hypothetical protein
MLEAESSEPKIDLGADAEGEPGDQHLQQALLQDMPDLDISVEDEEAMLADLQAILDEAESHASHSAATHSWCDSTSDHQFICLVSVSLI